MIRFTLRSFQRLDFPKLGIMLNYIHNVQIDFSCRLCWLSADYINIDVDSILMNFVNEISLLVIYAVTRQTQLKLEGLIVALRKLPNNHLRGKESIQDKGKQSCGGDRWSKILFTITATLPLHSGRKYLLHLPGHLTLPRVSRVSGLRSGQKNWEPTHSVEKKASHLEHMEKFVPEAEVAWLLLS